jgi:hypothetical protein
MLRHANSDQTLKKSPTCYVTRRFFSCSRVRRRSLFSARQIQINPFYSSKNLFSIIPIYVSVFLMDYFLPSRLNLVCVPLLCHECYLSYPSQLV